MVSKRCLCLPPHLFEQLLSRGPKKRGPLSILKGQCWELANKKNGLWPLPPGEKGGGATPKTGHFKKGNPALKKVKPLPHIARNL